MSTKDAVAAGPKQQPAAFRPTLRSFRRPGNRRRGRLLRGGGFIVAVLTVWELASTLGLLNPTFASSPTKVITAIVELLGDPAFWNDDVSASAQGFLAGWSLAVAVGIVLGALMGLCGPIRDLLEPLVMAFYSTPRIALLPLFIVWFGFGFGYTTAVVFLSAVFSVLLNTISGVRSADEQLIRMARSFGAGRLRVTATVVLPGAAPEILSGIRQSAPHAVVMTVVAEMYSSGSGVGYLINQSAQLFQMDRLFALVVLLAGLGVVLNELLVRVQELLEPWREASSTGRSGRSGGDRRRGPGHVRRAAPVRRWNRG